jgi:hypothetical protein
MAHPNEDLVRGGFEAFGRGDLEALRREYFAEDIRWHFPGRGPLAGDYAGVDQVLELFGRIFELTGGTLRLDLHDVVANDEHAVALYTANGERAGRQLHDHTVGVFHAGDGKITQVWLHADDLYAADEFWS